MENGHKNILVIGKMNLKTKYVGLVTSLYSNVNNLIERKTVKLSRQPSLRTILTDNI